MMKRGTGMFVAWKERLFLLTSKQLIYFEAGRLSVMKGSMLLRDIKNFDMALPVSKYSKKFCLTLARSSSSPIWVLRTDTEPDFIRWRDALRRKISPWGGMLQEIGVHRRGDSELVDSCEHCRRCVFSC